MGVSVMKFMKIHFIIVEPERTEQRLCVLFSFFSHGPDDDNVPRENKTKHFIRVYFIFIVRRGLEDKGTTAFGN
jgi:hypothetical protein